MGREAKSGSDDGLSSVAPITAEIAIPSLAALVEQTRGRRGVFVFLSGAAVGRTVSLDSPSAVLGRDTDCEVVLIEDGVSRRHARVTLDASGTHILEDLGSTNGTWVNGERVEQRVLLDGDRLVMGRAVLKFLVQGEADENYQRRLYEISSRDGLTNLYNRHYLAERLASEIAYARRHGSLLGALMIDLDHFKNINDTHGHLAGDQVLVEVAALIQHSVRGEDVAARYGGEEFLVVVRETRPSGVAALAERIRKGIQKLAIHYQGTLIPVTASIGTATRRGSEALQADELIQAADRMLYVAKSTGRNRVRSEQDAERDAG